MKKSILILVCALIYVGVFLLISRPQGEEYRKHFSADLEKIQANYRFELAREISEANEVYLFRVDPEAVTTEGESSRDTKTTLGVIHNKSYTTILSERRLDEGQGSAFLKLFARAIKSKTSQPVDGALKSHLPKYGVQVYRGDHELLYEGTFSSDDFPVIYPGTNHHWLATSDELLQFCSEVFPKDGDEEQEPPQ